MNFSYENHEVLRNIDFLAGSGELIAVLGPNGVGKSTLFKCILGLLKPSSGSILLGDSDIKAMSRSELAKRIAYIPQSSVPSYNYTVLDTVLMGITNKLSAFETPSAEHVEEAVSILESLGIADLRHRGCGRLSGGELQLVLLARALLQSTNIIIMDEPTANLDYGNQFKAMEHIKDLVKQGYTVIFSTHDPNLALLHASRVLSLKDGTLAADGSPQKVLTEKSLSLLYNIGVVIREVEYNGANVNISLPSANFGEK